MPALLRSMNNTLYLSLILLLSPTTLADDLKSFVSDGCSAFPDGTLAQNTLWLSCCREHDFNYWKGGTFQQRLESDRTLKSCVVNVGEPEIALLMLAGVRVGGTPFLPTQFRWGYGWPYPRFYGPLSTAELQQIQESTAHDHSAPTKEIGMTR